jgi:hypothetical protein
MPAVIAQPAAQSLAPQFLYIHRSNFSHRFTSDHLTVTLVFAKVVA